MIRELIVRRGNVMDGIKMNDVSLFLGKIPNRKQECFYFAEGTSLYPIAYVSKANLPEAKRLWGKMIREQA